MRLNPLSAAVLAVVSVPALAGSPEPLQSTPLPTIVVTATRFDQPISESLAPVTVITDADIKRLQPKSLLDLLAGQAGISVANAGGMGQLTSLFMRGTNSSHTLVLIDGVRMGSVTSGGAAWAQIPVDQIARIEIVRGPRSSLYGSDAIGGVIQIFTRHGTTGGGLMPSFQLSGGSHNTWNSQVGLSAGSDHGWFNVSLGAKYTRGINSCKVGAGTVFAGCFANEPDDDGYRAYSSLLNGGYRWDNGIELAANFFRTTNFVEYDGSFQNFSRHAQQVEGVHLTVPAGAAWTMTFSAGRSLDKATNFHDRVYTGYSDSRRDQMSWLNDVTLAPGQMLSVGVDWQHEHVDSDTLYTHSDVDDTAVFAQYQGMFGANEVQLSARRDHNQQFGNHNTGALAWGYHFDGGLVLSASYASAFHAPTFNDLYYPSFPGLPPSADPHLKPEKSRNVEMDLAAHHEHWYWQASVYENRIDDLIALDSNFTPGNISKARIRGFEGEVGGQWQDWTWKANATWMKPQNTDGGSNDGNLLPRRSPRSMRIDLDRQLGTFSVGTTFKTFSPRYDDVANVHRLGGYTTLDLRAGWQFAAHWRAQVSIDNLLDRDYETVYYYNQPGRTGMLTLRYVP